VEGANWYVFSVFEQTPSGRRQIIRVDPYARTSYTLSDLSLLDYEKTYIWQVEAVNRNQHGRLGENSFSVAARQQPGLLPPPGDMRPAEGHRINAAEIRSNRSITFSWSAVEGANSYIFSIYEQTPSDRRQIIRIDPHVPTSYTLSDLSLLDYEKTYIWQVEAVNRDQQGRVERHGRPGENSLVMDIRSPGRMLPGDTGVLYGK
jgi:hypothetical protein